MAILFIVTPFFFMQSGYLRKEFACNPLHRRFCFLICRCLRRWHISCIACRPLYSMQAFGSGIFMGETLVFFSHESFPSQEITGKESCCVNACPKMLRFDSSVFTRQYHECFKNEKLDAAAHGGKHSSDSCRLWWWCCFFWFFFDRNHIDVFLFF